LSENSGVGLHTFHCIIILLDQNSELEFYLVSSLKQKYKD